MTTSTPAKPTPLRQRERTNAFTRFIALFMKELRQIARDKRLIFILLFPPTVQLVIYGLVLNPEIRNIPMVVVDEARTPTSRALIDKLAESGAFVVGEGSASAREADRAVVRGEAIAELTIPPDFQRKLNGGQTPSVQLIVNAVDAFTSGLASGYALEAIASFNPFTIKQFNGVVKPNIIFAYNPGLISSWFFVPGMLGMVLTMTSSLVATGVVGREKDRGTMEQLLVTPAGVGEILAAKVLPLFVLLFGDVLLGLGCARLIFGIPFNGNILLFLACSALFVIVGMSIGIVLATVTRNQQQAQLLAFFVNLPIIQLSGSIAPFESMPVLCQRLSWFNPLRHFTEIVRAIVLRGAGLDIIWPNILMLAAIAVVFFVVSITAFRRQAT